MSLGGIRSIRGRVTLIAAAVTACVLIPAGIAGAVAARELLDHQLGDDNLMVGAKVAGAVRGGDLGADIPIGRQSKVTLIQVVDRSGRITASSDPARGLPALSDHRPPPGNRVKYLDECDTPIGCVTLVGIRITDAADSPFVYAGRPLPLILTGWGIELIIAAQVVALVFFVSWLTWYAVGQALRSVEAIRSELREISVSDLSRRVPVPGADDEIARLAQTANETLDRLETAVERQRRFASDASHELRTPITGLRTQLEAARLHPHDTDLPATIDAALAGTGRLEAIVTDLLILAKLGRPDWSPTATEDRIDLGKLVTDEVAQRRSAVPITVNAPPGVTVRGARMQLARILANLLDNAERHADEGVEVQVGRDGHEALLAVTDDGRGIAHKDRERVFDRFTRLDEARSRDAGGTGLGLAIAREVATEHGGTLRVEESRRGARFVLRLAVSR